MRSTIIKFTKISVRTSFFVLLQALKSDNYPDYCQLSMNHHPVGTRLGLGGGARPAA